MGTLLLLDIAYAAGIAFSPTPIVTVILVLFGQSASHSTRRNAIGFLIGWMLGIWILGLTVYALVANGIISSALDSSYARPVLVLILGGGLVYLAWWQWRRANA